MVVADAGSLAGIGAVNLVDSRGDLGTTFSDTFSSDSLRVGTTAALTTDATTNLNLSFDNGSDIASFAGQRVTPAAIDAGIRTDIEGGSLSDMGNGVESAVAHVAAGVLFNAVGDLALDNRWANGSPEKNALHALTGGTVAEAMGGDFRTGALAAGANEAPVEHLAELPNDNPYCW